jgi:ribosomal protein S18 acetylase RimI-like enzyme
LTRPTDDWAWVAPALTDLGPPGTVKLFVSPFPTPDLRLDGLHLMGHPPFMVRPPQGPTPDPIPGLEIQRVQSTEDLGLFERILIDGYPIPDMDPSEAPSLFRADYLEAGAHLYLGLLDGTPVATAAAHVAAGVSHVEFIATLPQYRGRGIGRAMTHAASVSAPNCPAVLITSDDGRGVYESLGYLSVSRWTIWMTN